jgi:benzoyl-CoA reductase/2-hydroxyglutaryl-CoA dehydratase subunit BcrC/BadD/HgdB
LATGGNMGPFEEIKKLYEHRDRAAWEWKAKGGKIVGYISDDVPDEMVLAAGFFPFRMSGNPAGGTAEADKYTEYFLDPSIRSILNMLLTGRYTFLDFIIIPHHSDATLKLYHQLWWIHRVNPAITFPPVYFFDILHTPFLTSALFVRDRLFDLKKQLETWSGAEITNEALSHTIAIGNENRALLRRIAELRIAEKPRLSGTEALQIISTSAFMLKEEHNKLLTQFLDGAASLPERAGVRLFIEGSDLDNLQFYELVESCNAVIVAENSSWGNRYFDDPVDESADPMEALADRYHARPSRLRTQTSDQKVHYCVQNALKAKAQGTIFYLFEWDPSLAWDQPDEKKLLDEKGIPSLCFRDQKYSLSGSDRATLKTGLEQFVAAIGQTHKEVSR